MMAYTFTPPDFITEATTDAIHARMMAALPDDIDDMPGGFPWDFTRPSAIELSRFVTFDLYRALMVVFPQYAWEDWLDLHGERKGVVRRAARKATGTLRVTTGASGIGLEIPAGTVFCTPSADGAEAILFETDEDCTVTTGEAYIPITALVAGSGSNVMQGAVSLAFRPIQALKSIANTEDITDGTDVEDDETYRERVMEAYRNTGESFVGCPSDYVRWAKEVSGVGSATCIPTWNGPGTVKLVVTDMTGNPASAEILSEVYQHITAGDPGSLDRMTNTDAVLTVSAPTMVTVAFTAELSLETGTTLAQATAAVVEGIEALYSGAVEDGELKWADCIAAAAMADGVYDVRSFTVNGGTSNVAIAKDEVPQTGTVAFSEYGEGVGT